MGTPQSQEAYTRALQEGRIESLSDKIMNLIAGHKQLSSLEIQRLLEVRGIDTGTTRNVASVLSSLWKRGLLNIDTINPSFDHQTKMYSAVYYIPLQPLTREDVLRRQLQLAIERRNAANKSIDQLLLKLSAHGIHIGPSEYEVNA